MRLKVIGGETLKRDSVEVYKNINQHRIVINILNSVVDLIFPLTLVSIPTLEGVTTKIGPRSPQVMYV